MCCGWRTFAYEVARVPISRNAMIRGRTPKTNWWDGIEAIELHTSFFCTFLSIFVCHLCVHRFPMLPSTVFQYFASFNTDERVGYSAHCVEGHIGRTPHRHCDSRVQSTAHKNSDKNDFHRQSVFGHLSRRIKKPYWLLKDAYSPFAFIQFSLRCVVYVLRLNYADQSTSVCLHTLKVPAAELMLLRFLYTFPFC